MKKLIVISSIMLLCITMLKAQYAPVGSKWYYGVWHENGPTSIQGVYTYTCDKDTIINNEIFSKVVYSAFDDTTSRIFYLSKDSMNIYYWKYGAKKVLFRTDSRVNDTIQIDCYTSNSMPPFQDTVVAVKVVIDRIEYEKLNTLAEDSLRVFQYRFLQPREIAFSASVGFFTETLINTYISVNRDLIVLSQPLGIPEGGNYLRCFNSDNYQYKSKYNINAMPCEFNNMSMNETSAKNEINVYPNPNTGSFSILFTDTSPKQIRVFDLFGNLVSTFVSADEKTTIDLTNKARGVYFIFVESESGNFYAKFLIK